LTAVSSRAILRRAVSPYYSHAGITIFHADCRDVLPELTWDVVITDPPYSEHVHRTNWTTADNRQRRGLGFEHLSPRLRQFCAAQFARTPRWVLAFTDFEGLGGWRSELLAAGLEWVRTGVWDRVNAAPQFSGDRPAQGCDGIAIAHPPGRKSWNGGGRSAVFRFPCVHGGEHPSSKPLSLMSELIQLFANPGDVILDPFCGSGSTLRAAKDLGFQAIGIESNERWCEVSANRLAQGVMFGVDQQTERSHHAEVEEEAEEAS
jgi:DNA modification methylase